MIGVFDSGSGGLTVLHALLAALPPEQDFVYFGDHAHAPYGDRSPDEIYDCTIRGVELLFSRGADLVLLACNTASAVALRRLQTEWLPTAHPTRRVLGVFVPVVEEITGAVWGVDSRLPAGVPVRQTVGLFATPATVASDAFAREIHKHNPEIRVVSQACPTLVSSIESGADDEILRAAIQKEIDALQHQVMENQDIPPLDTVVLGCTHYPLVAHLFRDLLPSDVSILSQPDLVATRLAAYLAAHPEFARAGTGARLFLTSGDPAAVSALAARFFGSPIAFQHVAL